MPEHFASPENAIDLASAAYMKAYKFGGKKPVGLGLTASVASEKEHRGEHRVDICVITDDNVWLAHQMIDKGVGEFKRQQDGSLCNDLAFTVLTDALGLAEFANDDGRPTKEYQDASGLAKERFFARPLFMANGKRLAEIPHDPKHYYRYNPYALMPGAYNPPHEGHFGTAEAMLKEHGMSVIFEVTAEPPHKDALSLQQLLQRAKMLQGYNRIFTRKEPFYIDKARTFTGIALVLGADAMVRMLDPKWGIDTQTMFKEFSSLHSRLFIGGRDIDGKFVTRDSIEKILPEDQQALFHYLTKSVSGKWDISSTELRKRLL